MLIFQVITRCELGGAQSVVVSLANLLCREHKVVVIAGEGDGKMFDLLDERVTVERCSTLRRELSPINDMKTVWTLRRLYQKYRPDVVHLHSSKAGMLGRLAFPKRRIVFTVHGFDSIRLRFRNFLIIERLMQRNCTAIVGVSKYDERNMKSERIWHNVSYIHNGIPIAKVDENLSWNIPSRYSKKILCIARLAPPKRVDLFIETAQLLPEYAFIWIGNMEEVKEKPENVFFLGNIPDAGRYNALADVFMLPSNYEGLPMVILEAMSYGLPVVASDVGGIHEIIENDVNGYTLENKAEFFAGKIQHILENSTIYAAFSKNTLKRFSEKLTDEKMLAEYMKLYRNIHKY